MALFSGTFVMICCSGMSCATVSLRKDPEVLISMCHKTSTDIINRIASSRGPVFSTPNPPILFVPSDGAEIDDPGVPWLINSAIISITIASGANVNQLLYKNRRDLK